MKEASLRQVLAALRARWVLVLILALPVLAASWGYAAQLPPAHTATTILSFAPEQGRGAGSSFVNLLPRYEVTATTPQSLNRAEQAAGLANGELAGAVRVDLPGNSLELTLAVTTPDEQASVAATNSLAQTVVEAADDDPRVTVWNPQEPDIAGDETPRRQLIAVLAGLLLAPLPGAALALLLEGSRPRVRVPEDLAAQGVPVLQSSRLLVRHRGAGDEWALDAERSLQLWLLVLRGLNHARVVSPDSTPEVTAISVDGPSADAAHVVESLNHALTGELPREGGLGRPVARIRAVHGLDVGDTRQHMSITDAGPASSSSPESSSSSPEQAYVLVVRTGVPLERVRAAVELIRHQGGHVLGSVLLTR